MDLKTKGLDRQFIIAHLTVKTYPVPGMDVYEMRIYYKGAYLKSVEVDGIELESWRYKDEPDPDSKTYDEFEAMGKPEGVAVRLNPPKADEAERKEGWD